MKGWAEILHQAFVRRIFDRDTVPIMESFATTYRNRTFVRLVAAFVLLIVGFQLVMGFNNFITIFFLYGGDNAAASSLMAQNGTLWALVGIAGVAPMTLLSQRLGKRTTVIIALLIIIALRSFPIHSCGRSRTRTARRGAL